jgi:hypothetical protein
MGPHFAIRRYVAVVFYGLMLFETLSNSFGVTTDNTQSYTGLVNDILAFITDKQAPTPGTGIDSWDNAQNTASKSDTVAIFRLVTNAHVTLDTTTTQANQILSQSLGGGTTETLATYYNLTSDGDGTTTTGFLASAYGSGIGSGNYLYVGGGSSAWETANSLPSGGTQFLASTKTITHIYKDGAVLLTLTVRGWNGEDFGSSSDNTEAPDSGTFSATFALRGTSVTH